jgi:ATP adenylyltransferase
MVLLNKYPYNSGHLLIIPLRHIGELLSLSDEEYNDLMKVVKLATKAMTHIYKPSAMNLGMNHGAMAGAGIPDHLHFHIIPRWSGDLNFFPLIAGTKVVIETLEQTYQHYLSYFKEVGI